MCDSKSWSIQSLRCRSKRRDPFSPAIDLRTSPISDACVGYCRPENRPAAALANDQHLVALGRRCERAIDARWSGIDEAHSRYLNGWTLWYHRILMKNGVC